MALGSLALLGGGLSEGVSHAAAMREACTRLGDKSGIGVAERMLGVMLTHIGTDRARARFHLQAARRIAAGERDVESERVAILNLIKIAGDAGDADEVLQLAEAGWSLSPRFARALVRQAFLFAYLYAHMLHGSLGQALDRAEMVRADADGSAEFLTSSHVADQLADLYLCLGDAATVHAMLDAVPEAVGGGSQQRLRLALVRSSAHLVASELDAARQLLDGWQDSPGLSLEMRAQLILQRAEVARLEGRLADAHREFGQIGELSNRELAMTAAALRLRLAGSGVEPAAIGLAQSLLAGGRAPVGFVLDLRIALVAALDASGLASEAASERARVHAELARLAATLGRHDDRRGAFLARHAVS